MNISLILQMAAEAEPDRTALVCNGRRWTYGTLWQAANGAAVSISRSGCSYVALLDESSEATAIALFGAALAGVPYVPLNYRLADADLAALLHRIKPAYAVGDVERIVRLNPEGSHRCLQRRDFVAAADSITEPFEEKQLDDGAVAAQIFTSGTTSAPKAALLKHENLLSYILGTVEFGSADPEEGSLVCVPPYHIAGIAALLSSIYSLRKIVLLPAFDPDAWLTLVSEEKVSNAFVVPTMLSRIIGRIDENDFKLDLSSLQAIAYGGGPMPLSVIQRAMELFPECGFTNAYGLTETSSTIALLSPDDHRAAFASTDPAVRMRLGSVGRPLPTIELEIRDEAGRVLPAGERGEIYVRGEQVSGEYRERTALDAEGWFATRDAGWLDHDGYLFLGGRADDVIVRGGENISPAEIEEVLMTHPAIADAAAVAVPSAEWGEAVGIAVTCKPDSAIPDDAELKMLIKNRLRSSRVPERVAVLEALPYNEMGKLLRREIRKLFSE
ncbi:MULTISPECIES: class I adenylate-forming enzyme family protein [unclassified Ketobacter]|uniref:class I adenylate-forming enzyme family protein n=1 Tax=unclassified Ketobacter TaxID=2639109 RepID=UPI000F2AB577|nr:MULTISPECIES: class I adenylate-forming enzyme family protein [unclassified Ketobacter]RLT90232.1 MAG: long-chain fatty acid--CoA ligase [Ketobacter sp. GenoA1]RLT93571.1 MAG: long-chain fatty acid--CoA ligase [Ketobacter sp.]